MIAPLLVSGKELTSFNRALESGVRDAIGDTSRHFNMSKLPTLTNGRTQDFELLESGHSLTAINDRQVEQGVIELHSHRSRKQRLLAGIQLSWIEAHRQKLRYSGSRIVIFYAWGNPYANEPEGTNLRQLLRLEWEGVDESGIFMAGQAAHPHWQVDRWLAGREREAVNLAERIRNADTPRDFGSVEDSAAYTDLKWIRAVHFAAAARWADDPLLDINETTCHALPPTNLSSLLNWVISATRYIKDQFGRALDSA